jgi:trans-2,3-dihydro-3-hydroxyanthranilate isomerase
VARSGSAFGRALGDRLFFEEKAGLVPVDIVKDGASIVGARLTAPRPLSRGDDAPVDIVAAACGIAADDIETSRHLPCVASCGTAFIFAELKNRRALAQAQPRGDIFSANFPIGGATGIHLYVLDGSEGIDVWTRMFAPLHGVPEDPATGSANVALVGLLASLKSELDLSLQVRIAQGVEMGRPSLLEASANKRGGQVVETRIGGRCVPVMSGAIEI